MIATMLLALGRYGPGGGWGGGWWVGRFIGTLLFLAVLGVLAWALLRRFDGRRPTPTESARQILAERFARGEIGEEEYRTRLGQLS